MDETTRLARAYWDSEESRDLERILAHFDVDATWSGPGCDYRGVQQFRRFYENSIAGYPHLTVTILETIGDSRRAAIRWRAELQDHDNRVEHLLGVNFMTFQLGVITDLATFFDPTPRSD